MVVASSCATAKESNVSYDELASSFARSKNTKLCFWYYDSLRSSQDSTNYHIQYICAPSENYDGSKVIVMNRSTISKAEVKINSKGGKITINEIEQK